MIEKNVTHTKIDISTWAYLKVLILILTIWFLYLIRDILAIVFFSVILASAVDPVVDALQNRKIPRALGILFIYLLLLGFVAVCLSLIVPAIILQSQELLSTLPAYFDSVSAGFDLVKYYTSQYGITESFTNTVNSFTESFTSNGKVFSFLSGIVGGVISFILILVITFYMVVQENAIKKAFRFLAPPKYQPYFTQLFHKIQKKIGLWLRGQLILSFIVGLLSYVGLLLIGMPYALVLALIAGIAELVPYIGPVLGAIPAIFIGLTISPLLAFAVLILYIVIQQLENNILVPKIMQKAIGLNPLISICSLLIGAKIAGVLGAVMAIPVATALSVIVSDFFSEREQKFFSGERSGKQQ